MRFIENKNLTSLIAEITGFDIFYIPSRRGFYFYFHSDASTLTFIFGGIWMSRETAQLFDLMFKWIIKGASSSAVVHFINGIYKKDYPLDATQVTIEPNELIKENSKSGNIVKIIPDIVITLQHKERKDVFLIEAQINNDAEMTCFPHILFF